MEVQLDFLWLNVVTTETGDVWLTAMQVSITVGFR